MTDVKGLIERLATLKTDRSSFEALWDQIAKVVLPAQIAFALTPQTQGNKVGQNLYDATGVHACELLASGFFSLLTNPTAPWAEFQTVNPRQMDDRDMAVWLKECSQIATQEIQKPATGFTAALHEFYLEYCGFGSACMYVTERRDLSGLLFQTLPLHECYFVEDNEGRITTLFRNYERTVEQLVDYYGFDKCAEEVRKLYSEGKRDTKFSVLHVIKPAPKHFMGMTFTSEHIDVEHKHLMLRRGYHEMPHMAARFYKMSWESYGRGPGSNALPDLQMLQEMMKTILRGAQKIVDPPLMAPDQGFVNPIRTVPGGVNYFRPGTDKDDRISPLVTGGRPDLGFDLVQDVRARVREIFFVDQLQLNEGPEMTATEVIQRTEEKMRLMGPVVGRTQTELLGPMLQRVFGLLYRAGKLPPPPPHMLQRGFKLKIVYTSPIARAQEQVEANSLLRTWQVISPYIAMRPDAMDNFNTDNITRKVGKMFSLDPEFYNTPKEVETLRQQRVQQQQMKEMAAMAKDGGIGLAAMADGAKTLGELNV